MVVCDAGPIIHLDELESLPLLRDFKAVLVPQAVWDEVSRHRPQSLKHPEVTLNWVSAPPVIDPDLAVVSRLFPLHEGETQALSVARVSQADLMLTDDTAARLAARHMGIPVHGSIGILLRAIRRGQRSRDEILALLRLIPNRSTLHIKPALLADIIRQVEDR